MRILLDTHVLVWWLFAADRLSQRADRWIAEADQVYVSAVSIYEIEYKRREQAGRAIDSALARLPNDLVAGLEALDLELLPITAQQARDAARLTFSHGDPWDRLLVAQARTLGIPLISRDQRLSVEAQDVVIW